MILTNPLMLTIVFSFLGYISGSLLYSEFFMKLFHGKSLIETSSNHNPGASNAYIYGGFWCGTLSVIMDLLKGAIPIAIYVHLAGSHGLGLTFVLISPVIGHGYSCFYRLKGGIGVAVSFGIFIGLFPILSPLASLIILYLLSLLIPKIGNTIRSIITYLGLSISSVVLFFNNKIELNILIGILVISCLICLKMKNNLKYSNI